MTSAELFRGPQSLRINAESLRLLATIATLPLTLGLLGFVLHETFDIHNIALIIVAAMVYVSLGRGRFLGAGVRIHESQFGKVYEIVVDCARRLGMDAPAIFLRDDNFTPIVSLGLGEPYAIVISSHWIEAFNDDELRFVVARELAHIRSGHTRISSLLSTNGRENPVIAFAFGSWLRATEYTADRLGLLLCGSVDTAISAMAITTFGHVGRRVDIRSFVEQRREIDAEPALRMGEWLAATPYVTNRIAQLASFARTPLYQSWQQTLRSPLAPGVSKTGAAFAGPWRRGAALVIDLFLVGALVPTIVGFAEPGNADSAVTKPITVTVAPNASPSLSPAKKPAPPAKPSSDTTDDDEELAQAARAVTIAATAATNPHVQWQIGNAIEQVTTWGLFAIYLVLLVGVAGQTFGMMICDLHVVDADFRKISFTRVLIRYTSFIMSLVPLVVGFTGLMRRVQPFEIWSKTRIVSGNVRPGQAADGAVSAS